MDLQEISKKYIIRGFKLPSLCIREIAMKKVIIGLTLLVMAHQVAFAMEQAEQQQLQQRMVRVPLEDDTSLLACLRAWCLECDDDKTARITTECCVQGCETCIGCCEKVVGKVKKRRE